jgi:hypothetical protein
LVPAYEYSHISPFGDWQLKSSSSFTSQYQKHNADCIKFHFHFYGYHFRPVPSTQKLCKTIVDLEINAYRIKHDLLSHPQKTGQANNVIYIYIYIYIPFERVLKVAHSMQWLVTGCTTEGSEFGSRESKHFKFPISSTLDLRPTLPPFKLVTCALSLGVKEPVREADHSLRTCAEIKKTWIYTSISTTRLHGIVLN